MQSYNTLDDAMMSPYSKEIVRVTVSDVCWFPLCTDVYRNWKYQCLKINYIFVVEKSVCFRCCVIWESVISTFYVEFDV
jgi:hypothetical protein